MRRLLARLRREDRGAATIEFAMWSAFFFMGMMVALDFAMWRTQELRLNSAVEQGSMIAFVARDTLDQTWSNTNIRGYVQTAATSGTTVPTVTVTCNGTTTSTALAANCSPKASRQCVCVNQVAGKPSYAPATCGATCPSTANTTAGYYMKIRANLTYHSAILPADLLGGKAMIDEVVVRLQ